MTRKNYHHGDLKEAIIACARKALVERGADALSLRAIAADAGVSHMAPYAHFKNKKELFQAIAASGFAELVERLLANRKHVSSAQALVLAYGVTYIEFALENPQLYRLMLGQVEHGGRRFQQQADDRSDANRPVVSAELEASSKRTFKVLKDAFAEILGDESEVKIRAQALGAWSMVHGMAALIIEGHFDIPEGMALKDFLEMAVVQSMS